MARKLPKSAPAGGKPAKPAPAAGSKPAKEAAEQADRVRSGAAAEERRLLHEAAWRRMFGKIGGQNPYTR